MVGYGHRCSYSGPRARKRNGDLASSSPTNNFDAHITALSTILDRYDGLVQNIRSKLTRTEQNDFENFLASLRTAVDHGGIQRQSSNAVTTGPVLPSRSQSLQSRIVPPGYHGEASDVHFYNVVKRILHDRLSADHVGEAVVHYEQDELDSSKSLAELSLELPDREVVEDALDIYFSTIHIAYPFLMRSSLTHVYEHFKHRKTVEESSTSSFATFCELKHLRDSPVRMLID